MDTERPYTPATLAERWACSDESIRKMIARGELRAFQVGKMWRIPAHVVDAYEEGRPDGGA